MSVNTQGIIIRVLSALLATNRLRVLCKTKPLLVLWAPTGRVVYVLCISAHELMEVVCTTVGRLRPAAGGLSSRFENPGSEPCSKHMGPLLD